MYVGYDHVVGKASARATELVCGGEIGAVQTLDVEFREHWGGIFAAHPWLDGPSDSYLGFWEKGGGASGEHSHAINLWQHFAHVVGAGRVREVDARLRYVDCGGARYDDLCMLHLRTEGGLLGRVVQDVVTTPHRKRARIQGETGAIEWVCNYDAAGDAVLLHRPGKAEEVSPSPRSVRTISSGSWSTSRRTPDVRMGSSACDWSAGSTRCWSWRQRTVRNARGAG